MCEGEVVGTPSCIRVGAEGEREVWRVGLGVGRSGAVGWSGRNVRMRVGVGECRRKGR